ncbi:hypothetical protein Cal7507_0399 [Calothrix sp. PCC 7507]|nr:hypothetical protein Cal7507_0399 [Calothrix sp. PCC 7507]
MSSTLRINLGKIRWGNSSFHLNSTTGLSQGYVLGQSDDPQDKPVKIIILLVYFWFSALIFTTGF